MRASFNYSCALYRMKDDICSPSIVTSNKKPDFQCSTETRRAPSIPVQSFQNELQAYHPEVQPGDHLVLMEIERK